LWYFIVMTPVERQITGYDPDAHIATPRLDSLSDQEVALDWIVQVLNQETGIIDAFFITPEGSEKMRQIRRGHEQKYKDTAVYDPNAEGLELLASFDKAEYDRRNDELEVQLGEVASTDPGVMAKNRFLARLADQMDGTAALKKLMGQAIDMAADAGHELSGEETGGIKEVLSVLASFEGGHVIHLLVSMRRYAEAVGNNAGIYQQQFMGLWDIYCAGQAAGSSPES
jgi:hypothetical protein